MKINILALAVIASGMAAVATQAKTLTPEEALARVGSSAGLHKIAGKNAPQSRLVYTEEALPLSTYSTNPPPTTAT